jgi:hypothetical protein
MDSKPPIIPPPKLSAENLTDPAHIKNVDPSMLNGGGGRFQRLSGPDGPFHAAAVAAALLLPAPIET